MHGTIEREAKYRLEPGADGPDLTRLPDGLVAVAMPETRLSARYFDTPGLVLLRRGITLRHRRSERAGEEDQWTLKLPDPVGRGVYRRTELSWPGVAGTIPDEARRLLRAATVGAGDIGAVATLVTVRRRYEVRSPAGRRMAEVDDDRVTVTAPTARVFRQIEVELGPDVGDELIARLAKVLRRAGAERSPDTPKLSLALGRAPVTGPRTTPPGHPDGSSGMPDDDATAALRATIARGLDDIVTQDIALRIAGESGLEGESGQATAGSVELVHKARVACRRLRSDLKTFAPVVEPDAAARLSAELRWWADILGTVRDLDVLEARVVDHARRSDPVDEDGFAAVTARIAARRAGAWAQVLATLDGDRYLALLAALGAAADVLPRAPSARRPEASGTVRHLVRRPWRRLHRAVRALPAEPSDTELHRVRILAKQLRYASEAAEPAVGRPARRTARDAAALQTVLGDHHDAVVAEAALRSIAGTLSGPGALAAGLGVAAEQRLQHRQRVAWGKAWKHLDHGGRPKWLRS